MSYQIETISPLLQQYIRQNSLREPSILEQLREETSQMHEHNMQAAPELVQFLQLLIKLIPAKNILEVGAFTGYSALAMALALPADGKLLTCDINSSWTDIAKRYWQLAGVTDKIELRLAPALDTLEDLLTQGLHGNFDLMFIDANKSDYSAYYEYAMTLLRRGGLVAIDNVLWSGKVADPTVNDSATLAIRQLNKRVAADSRVFISMLPIADGLLLAYKN